MNPNHPPTRRHFLLAGGAALLLAACNSDDAEQDDSQSGADAPTPTSTPGPAPAADSALTAADFEGLGTCLLTPEMTAGPFPLDEQFDRRDITEGLPGHPFRLGFRVVDESCAPVPGGTVEIWHVDATGDYSAFIDGGGGKDDGEGTTFLRGSQTAGDDGIVEFLTLFPGWYPGRAVHIHLRVHRDDATVLTSQVFFDADATARIYSEDPYSENGPPDTSNEDDFFAGDPVREGTLVDLRAAATASGPGTLGLSNLGIS